MWRAAWSPLATRLRALQRTSSWDRRVSRIAWVWGRHSGGTSDPESSRESETHPRLRGVPAQKRMAGVADEGCIAGRKAPAGEGRQAVGHDLKQTESLPNVARKADIFGRTRDRGRVVVRFVRLEGNQAVLCASGRDDSKQPDDYVALPCGHADLSNYDGER